MNTATLHSTKIPGFRIVPKHELNEAFTDNDSAFYVLLGRHGPPDEPRESVLFVDYVDNFLDSCQQHIDDLWEKHRVLITHVGVKLAQRFNTENEHNLTRAYERALAVQSLRRQLNPRFRRV